MQLLAQHLDVRRVCRVGRKVRVFVVVEATVRFVVALQPARVRVVGIELPPVKNGTFFAIYI